LTLKQSGVDNHIYGITTTAWGEILGRLSEDHSSNCAGISRRITQHAIDELWKERNTAKHGMETQSELLEVGAFESHRLIVHA
jgi:hypothetical protein